MFQILVYYSYIWPLFFNILRFYYFLLLRRIRSDERLVPEKYIRSTSKSSPHNLHSRYSLQFNVNTHGEIAELPKDVFWKIGSGGHCLYIVSSLDLIGWEMGERVGQYSIKDTDLSEPIPLVNGEQPLKNGPEYRGGIYVKKLT